MTTQTLTNLQTGCTVQIQSSWTEVILAPSGPLQSATVKLPAGSVGSSLQLTSTQNIAQLSLTPRPGYLALDRQRLGLIKCPLLNYNPVM